MGVTGVRHRRSRGTTSSHFPLLAASHRLLSSAFALVALVAHVSCRLSPVVILWFDTLAPENRSVALSLNRPATKTEPARSSGAPLQCPANFPPSNGGLRAITGQAAAIQSVRVSRVASHPVRLRSDGEPGRERTSGLVPWRTVDRRSDVHTYIRAPTDETTAPGLRRLSYAVCPRI